MCKTGEVKAGESKGATSFKTYIKNNEPQTAIRYSKRGYIKNDNITNIPLYLINMTKQLISISPAPHKPNIYGCFDDMGDKSKE